MLTIIAIPLSHLESWYPQPHPFIQIPSRWWHCWLFLQFPQDLLQFSPYRLPSITIQITILKFKLYYFHSTITNIEGYININAILWFLTYSAKQNCVCICDIEVVVIILMHYRLNEMMGIVTACVQFVYIHKDM